MTELAYAPPGPATSNEVARVLLAPTLNHALRCEFYRDKWRNVPHHEGTVDPSALDQLPFTHKAELVAAGSRAQVRDGLICDEIFTSGTTGRPLVTAKGDREQEYARAFYQRVGERPGAVLARGLLINNPFHGHQVAIPAPIHLHKIGIYDRSSFDHGWSVLAGTHRDRGVADRCSYLIGLERCLRAFSLEAQRRRPADWKSDLAYVMTYGHCLTRAWRERLREIWCAEVIDRFSLSEVFGGATRVPPCEWWHFDPVLIAEVVGATSGRRLLEGRGILVLTALYPFQEAQPLVRYWTSDLVEVTHSRSSRPGTPAIKPLGRARCGVACPETDDWALTPLTVFEVIDEMDEIQRLPLFRDSSNIGDPFAIGHPKYRLDAAFDGGTCIAQITLALKEDAGSRRRARLEQSITDRLIVLDGEVARDIARGTLSIEVNVVDDLRADVISYSN